MDVVSKFLAAWTGDPAVVDRAALAESLARLASAGRATHPGVALADDVFAAFIAPKVDPGGDPVSDLDHLQASDLYLACGCASGDGAALAQFRSLHHGLVTHVFHRMRIPSAAISDLCQDFYERVLVVGDRSTHRIADYGGRPPLTSWIYVVAARLALNHLRVRRPADVPEDDVLEVLVSPEQDLELAYLKDRYAPAFRAAFRAALGELADREQALLRYVVLDGLTPEEIGRIYKTHRTTVGRWLHRTQRRLLVGTRRALMKSLAAGKDDVDSILRLLGSRLEASFGTVAERGPDARPGRDD